MIDESLREVLIDNLTGDWTGTGKVQSGFIDSRTTFPAIRFNRGQKKQEIFVSGVSQIKKQMFDINVGSYSLLEVQSIADEIFDLLHGYRNVFGDYDALLIQVDRSGDTYIREDLGDGDRGVHIAQITITIHYKDFVS